MTYLNREEIEENFEQLNSYKEYITLQIFGLIEQAKDKINLVLSEIHLKGYKDDSIFVDFLLHFDSNNILKGTILSINSYGEYFDKNINKPMIKPLYRSINLSELKEGNIKNQLSELLDNVVSLSVNLEGNLLLNKKILSKEKIEEIEKIIKNLINDLEFLEDKNIESIMGEII